MPTIKAALAAFLLLASVAARAQDQPDLTAAAKAVPSPSVSYKFLQLMGYPDELTRPEIQALLQKFVDQVHGKGFRYLGDENDFDHGHFLYAPNKWKRPIGILYHTQENAFKTHRDSPGSKYDYLDTEARNWIQFVDQDKPVENAKTYMRRPEDYPKTKEWQQHVKELDWTHYTIHYEMLDPVPLGIATNPEAPDYPGPSKPNYMMFRFKTIPCAQMPSVVPEDSNLIEVLLPAVAGARERVCLALGL